MNTLSRSSLRSPVLLFTIFFLLAAAIPPLSARDARVAMLGFENLNRDPRYDYLEGMIVGVLMYDMTRIDGVELVERARLDRIFEEQELRLTGLLDDADTARQVGQLAGADYLIEGDYAFLGREMVINLSIMKTDDGSSSPLSVRGYTENSIHELAEGIALEITGKPVILAGIDGERSLLSLSDEEPGSIEFYCNFIDGEIYVDGEFYGYTPGGRTPTLLEDLSPGAHNIRIEAGPNFGEIEWPHIAFKDWERDVEVKAGRKSVTRAAVYHFNSQIYDAMNLYRENWIIGGVNETEVHVRDDVHFIDRSGNTIPVSIELDARMEGEKVFMRLKVSVDGQEKIWEMDPEDEEIDFKEMLGIVEVDFERDWYSNSYWDFDLWLQRKDIHQGLHREE